MIAWLCCQHSGRSALANVESGILKRAAMGARFFVVELTADSKKKTVEGILRAPRLFGASRMAAPTGDGASRTRYVHVHAEYLGKDRFRVKTVRG